jgi:molecular chaperone GrpE
MTEPHATDSPEGGDAPLEEEAGQPSATPEASGDAEAPTPDELEDGLVPDEMEAVAKERDEYLDSLQRLQADFDNYRKRALRQQTDLLERASEQLVVQLLPVLDALDLAEAHAGGDAEGGDEALSQIGTLLRGTLGREGLLRIDTVGVAFDPNEHDAVAHEEAGEDDEPGPHVAEVMRAGYRLKGRVLRPAMVKVKG